MITVWVPLPPRILHPNHRGRGGFALSRAKAAARREGMLAAYNVRPAVPLRELEARAIFVGVRKDSDEDNLNAWLKATRDGIADAICDGGNDHGWHWHAPTVLTKTKEPPGVTICIWTEEETQKATPTGD